MIAATTVGIRELKNDLSRYVEAASAGEEVVITHRGRPVARLAPLSPVEAHLAGMLARGMVQAPVAARKALPEPLMTAGPVSDLAADQRR